ncbi:MAG TPA: NUDIX hydrolase [Minicystis sp.]|nr:NUDIX hydrolase [Minicystis sp.]
MLPRFSILSLPASVLGIGKEVVRHLLRRPVVGICAAGRTDDDRWLLIRRADTGTWALPGGTLEWGETLRAGLARELAEEAGVDEAEIERVVGVYSRPDRDPRFHAVTIIVRARIAPPVRPPKNPLEIREARLFPRSELPPLGAMGMEDFLAAALRDGETELE